MKSPKTNRRRFLQRLGLASAPALLLAGADARWIEPHRLNLRRVKIAPGAPAHRFAYFTDLHYKGDLAFARSVVEAINAQNPEFVCFGGDLIERGWNLPEALKIISSIQAPVYGVPGNHDLHCCADYPVFQAAFASTGGAWLVNEHRDLADGRIRLIGLDSNGARPGLLPLNPEAKNIVLVHYPVWADKLKGQKCDLLLAGHSHGGQVRLPLIGAPILPAFVGRYDLGLFQTEAGPLYVNPGIGWLHMDVRLNCRPEVTVFEV
jgi:predicted MPP superfamily phosphohydrolase